LTLLGEATLQREVFLKKRGKEVTVHSLTGMKEEEEEGGGGGREGKKDKQEEVLTKVQW